MIYRRDRNKNISKGDARNLESKLIASQPVREAKRLPFRGLAANYTEPNTIIRRKNPIVSVQQ